MTETRNNGTSSLREDVKEIKHELRELVATFQSFMIQYTKELSNVVNLARAAQERSCKNEKDIEDLTKQLAPLVLWMKIVSAIGSIVLIYLVTQVITKLFP